MMERHAPRESGASSRQGGSKPAHGVGGAGPAGEGAPDRTLRDRASLEGLAFDEAGLVTVVAQDAATGSLLMVAHADRQALLRTLETGEMHYHSRSRAELWHKGATSGNVQRVHSLHADCDGDAVLAIVDPAGPACHTGAVTCFGRPSGSRGAAGTTGGTGGPLDAPGAGGESGPGVGAVLERLQEVVALRDRERPEESYTTRLLADENLRLKKLGEETTELVVALSRGDRDGAAEEAADLLYHLLVALRGGGVSLDAVGRVLAGRRGIGDLQGS